MIESTFAKSFAHWDITLPEEDIKDKRNGHIQSEGWLIQYCFGKDENGEYLDYYATHKMTDDSHIRIYADGTQETLPTLSRPLQHNDDPTKQLQEEHNLKEMLIRKGFDKFTINMFSHAEMDKEIEK